jgi:hypothetical protein
MRIQGRAWTDRYVVTLTIFGRTFILIDREQAKP